MKRRRRRAWLLAAIALPVTAGALAYLFAPLPLRAKPLIGTTSLKAPAAPAPGPRAVEPSVPGDARPTLAAPASEPPGEAPAVASPGWPRQLTGRVLDPGRQPVARASLVIGRVEYFTDREGLFTIEAPPVDAPLLVKAPGFHRAVRGPRADALEVVLQPHAVKAAYLSYFGVSDKGIRARVLDLAERTELNAVVIDVKGDRGWIVYPTEISLAREAGAQGPVVLRDIAGLLRELKERGVYTIARVVTFKDNVLANHRRDLAVIDTRTGRPWIDNEKLAWVDPFREEVWRYNLDIAREAVAKGFDEVQFDYVRFPTDGRLSAARYARPNSRETRGPAISGFLRRARGELGPLGAFVAADVFGYTAFNENDTDIGQRLEDLAPHVDYLCPMVYPSGYHVGIPGLRNPMTSPYRIVFESVRLSRERAGPAGVRLRPWLQDFRDYAFDRRIFGPGEVRAQIRGAEEAGAAGWMLWNPRNDYTAAALTQKKTLAAR